MKPTSYDFLKAADPEISQALWGELTRQQTQIEMIASENFTSLNVMAAAGSVMTNKYAEGYPGRRYYGGCEYVDVAETLAIERAKELFGCDFANVQPHSGAQANQAVLLALLQPGDRLLGMSLESGGHLTHGAKVSMSGKWFEAHAYGVNRDSGLINMEEVAAQAKAHKPKLIIAGGSAYPRQIDFEAFRRIADSIGAYLMVDMAHFAGLVAGGVFPTPIPYAHVITTTTHKTLRGPRGGMILTNDATLAKKINSAVFPGNQGGPLMHIIAAKAVAFKEALQPEFKNYAQQVVKNARALSESLMGKGIDVITGGTDCHLLLLDLRKHAINGDMAEKCLERAGMTSNKNGIPFDPLPPAQTSGIRFGTPAATTRGFKEAEFQQIGAWVHQVLTAHGTAEAESVEKRIRGEVLEMCTRHPLYPELSQEISV